MTEAGTKVPNIGKNGGGFSKGWTQYPKYRDSGVEWLGEVPKAWRVMRIKHLLPARRTPAQAESYKLALENIASWTGKITGSSPDLEGEGLAFDEGDVLFGKLRPYLAKACVADKRGAAVGDFFVMRPSGDVLASYAVSLLLTTEFISLVDGSTFGVKMPRADWDFFADQRLPAPPLSEQCTIADFLDRETGRIDTLIAKKERQIELLQEKRQALITHAVTKGLDPKTKMKDSGVEWLGKIPEGWEVWRTRHLFGSVTSGSRDWAKYYADEGTLFFRITNIERNRIDPDMTSVQFVDAPAGAEGERSRIVMGDILISITADLGSVSVAGENITGGYVSQHVALCRPNSHVSSPRWLAYVLSSRVVKAQLEAAGYGGTKVQLGLEDVRAIALAKPVASDQEAIANYLDHQTARLDALTAKIESSIALLREYRTALISAAVTGKIDVRRAVEYPDRKEAETLPLAAETHGGYTASPSTTTEDSRQ